MKYGFTCSGHKNILATHKTTLEFTKDNYLTKKGDCIVGVNADFDLVKLKEFLQYKTINITIKVDDLEETIVCDVNKSFNSDKEIVIRLGTHQSDRTLGTDADKAAIHLDRKLIERIKNQNKKLKITITSH